MQKVLKILGYKKFNRFSRVWPVIQCELIILWNRIRALFLPRFKRQPVRVENKITGSLPMVYHEAGGKFVMVDSKKTEKRREIELFDNLFYSLMFSSIKNFVCPDDLSIITICNQKYSKLELLARRFGMPLKIYGLDVTNWRSNREVKIPLIIEACRELRTKYVICCDAFDVLFFESPEKILARFKSLGCRMLISGESAKPASHRKQNQDLTEFFESLAAGSSSPFKYLNSGFWIAEREFALALYSEASKLPPYAGWETSDQILLGQALFESEHFRSNVKIDYDCDIVFTVNSRDKKSVIGLKNVPSGVHLT